MVNVIRARSAVAKKNSAHKLGIPAKFDTLHNCLSCLRWPVCKDPQKAYNYRCSRYSESSAEDSPIEDQLAEQIKQGESAYGVELGDNASPLDEPSVEEEARIDKMIAAAIAENNPLPPDIRIRDGEIPQAPNYYTWLTDARFTGGDGAMPPFARQVYVGGTFYAEWCPRCSDMEWLDTMKVGTTMVKLEGKTTMLVNGKCPHCKVTRDELFEEGEINIYKDLTLIAGQRSTKTSTVNLMDAYNIHRWLKLPSPPKVFMTLLQQPFVITYTSKSFGQVNRNMWQPFLNIVNGSPWFRNYHKFLRKRGQELGEELFHVGDIFVKYRHRQLTISPSSPSGETMRGPTRVSAAIDEVSHMPLTTASGKDAAQANAKDTYDALRNSLETLSRAYDRRMSQGYYDLPRPAMYCVSSPKTINDWGMKLYRDSKGSTIHLGMLYTTWDFNPNLPRSHFAERFRTDPVGAARDFACQPPIGTNTWLDDASTIEAAFGKKRNMFDLTQDIRRTNSGKRVTTARLIQRTVPDLRWGCVLSIDVGSTFNSFAFSVTTVENEFDLQKYVREREEDDEDTEVITGVVPVRVVYVGEVIPSPGAPISLPSVYTDVACVICETLNVTTVVSDRWQNKKFVQDLEDQFAGLEYVEYMLRWDDFENYKNGLFDKKVRMPAMHSKLTDLRATNLEEYPACFKNKPMDHLAYQMMTVQEARGGTVIKGDATDDMFRCTALGYTACQDKDILATMVEIEQEVPVRQPALGLVRSMAAPATSAATDLIPTGQSSPIAMLRRTNRR